MPLQATSSATATLDEIVITPELALRPVRPSNPLAESDAFHAIARAMTRGPQETLNALISAAMKLCNAGAAGVSLLNKSDAEAGEFRWVALGGTYESYIHNTTPADHSPCGTCVDRGSAQLYHMPSRFFTYLAKADPPIVESLVVPFRAGQTIGTIWVISHLNSSHFSAEDVRVLSSLAEFAGATLAAQYATDQLAQSQQALTTHQKFAEQIVESSGDCIMVLDREGRLLSMNTPGLALMEIDDFAPHQNTHWTSFWEGASADDACAAVVAARDGKVSSFEGMCNTSMGTAKWWHVLVTPIFGAGHHPEKILVVSRDGTSRRQAEEKKREAIEVAQAANRNKDLFLAALSHELRTPLSPVILAVTAMQADHSLPPDAKHYLEMIRRNVQVEVRLIDDLLDVSRAVSGKLRMNTEHASVHALLKFVQETCTSDATRKSISCHFNLAAVNDHVTVDAARLQQVFWNVLKNSIKFSDVGQTVEVSTSNPSADLIEIRFTDHGRGIKADVMPRLFDAFDQGEESTTQKFGGLGLGLAISKALIEMNRGTIQVFSAGEKQGATFVVQLPTSKSAAALISPPPTPLDKQTAHKSLRLLIVEDHVDTARVLSVLLRSSGHQVKTAGTAAAALGAIASEPFDLVVSDVGLPDATGYELMREIRERFNVKGIAMTGYGMDEDFAKSREAGFVAHIVKPINVEQLEQVIRRVTSGTS